MKTNLKKISQLYTNMTLPVKASMWYLACSVLQKAIGFLTTPIFTRVMGTSDFGVVSMYNSWEAILTVLCTLYLYNGVYNNANRIGKPPAPPGAGQKVFKTLP